MDKTQELNIGDNVKVIDGPFSSLQGSIYNLDVDKKIAKVLITIFGRTTQVDIEINHIELIVNE
jgi:transcriptional antiterminator NusG